MQRERKVLKWANIGVKAEYGKPITFEIECDYENTTYVVEMDPKTLEDFVDTIEYIIDEIVDLEIEKDQKAYSTRKGWKRR